MLRTRLITAAIVLPLLVYSVLHVPGSLFVYFLAVVAAVGMLELMLMYRASRLITAAASALGGLCVLAYAEGMFYQSMVFSFLTLGTLRLFTKPEPEGALAELGPASIGLLYVAGLISCQVTLHRVDPGLVLYLYGSVWAADASAYFIGTRFGRHKMYKSMSPNKSWEGAAASVAGGALGALVMGFVFVRGLGLEVMLVSGLVIGAIAILGDLLESMLKRDSGVKDSGSFIPGHGGLLDKIDGSLYCGPVLVLILSLYGMMGESIRLPF